MSETATRLTNRQLAAYTLRWCNAQRKSRGLGPLTELPLGDQRDPGSCPCGKATGLRVYEHHAAESSASPSFDIPPSVCEFVLRFDRGEIPEYDAAVS